MNISAGADYALRALLVLAAQPPASHATAAELARTQNLPDTFLAAILSTVRKGGLVTSHRGGEPGYSLMLPPEQISVADVVRVVDGPLSTVRGFVPGTVAYAGVAQQLATVWVLAGSLLERILEAVTLADIVAGTVSDAVCKALKDDAPTPP